jgi:PKD domain-containing protein
MLDPATLEVVEFGPGGSGCPHTTVPAVPPIAVTAGAAVISQSGHILPGAEVTLSSILVEGNALSVEWNFGDGSKETVTYGANQITQEPSITHTFAKEQEVNIKEKILTDDLASPEVTVERKLLVGTLPVTPPVTAPVTPPAPPPGHAVLPAKEQKAVPVPEARLLSTSLTASAAGIVSVKVTCPATETSCSGTVTLRTLTAVSAGASAGLAKKHHAAILTLASGPFKVAGGQVATVKLHLSSKARALLARTHVLRARATIFARDPAGATHTTVTIVTIRAAKATHGRKH